MDIDQAIYIKPGHIVYDIYQNKLVVIDYFHQFSDGKITNISFNCLNSSQQKIYLPFFAIYEEFNDLCDEERFFIEWFNENKQNLTKDLNEIELLKKGFINGFAKCHVVKLERNARNMLQK